MHRFKKMKLVSMLVALVMAFGLIPFAAPQGAAADTDTAALSATVTQLQTLYYWLAKDSSGQIAVGNAYGALQNTQVASVENLLWPVNGTPLLPLGAVTGKFSDGGEPEIAQLIIDLDEEQYAQDTTSLMSSLLNLDSNDKNTVAKLLPGIHLSDIVNFISISQGAGAESALSPDWQGVMQGSGDVASIITAAMNYAASNGGGVVATALGSIGWNVTDLAGAELALDQQVDQGYPGENALLKAYVRSMTTASTYVITPVSAEESFTLMVETPVQPVQFTISVLGSDATGVLTPQVNDSAVTFTKAGGQFAVAGVSMSSLPVEITAYLSDPGSDWVFKANTTTVTAVTTATITVSQATNAQAITDNTPATTITVPSGVTGATINVASLIPAPTPTTVNNPIVTAPIQNSVTVDAAVTSVSATVPVQVVFPAGTTITAPADSNWNGVIDAPVAVTPPPSELPANANSVVAIDLGSGTMSLTFSEPVSILLPGQTGKSVGYITNAGTFTPITDKLTTDALPSGAVDGYYDDGTNITIWTTHFTTFVAYKTVVQSGGGGGGGGASSTAVTSTTGSATVNPAGGGVISLGTSPVITIPANALNGTAGVVVAIQPVSSPPAAPMGFMLLGNAYDFTLGGAEHYTFNSPVTLTFSFDPASVPAGETPVVYYYDSSSSQWVALTGTISGDTITVSVSHFTTYELMVQETTPPTPPTPVFSDVPAAYWASAVIDQLNGLGMVSGYPDGSFRPDSPITRAEFVTILDRALNLTAYTPATPDFQDVSPGDWFYGSVEADVYAGIVKGYGNGDFAPNAPITRQEIATVLINALGKADAASVLMDTQTGFTDDASIAAWGRGFVAEAVQIGLIKGYPDGSFAPRSDATRAEACVMINNLLALPGKK